MVMVRKIGHYGSACDLKEANYYMGPVGGDLQDESIVV